ncbi:hypothetical protein MS3_00006179 [Schistosoma haematobium]|uniref:Uncharacterized protein n=1 Tax=Schistosoma haematobium TaxID=6185 RepID=A0A922LH89_SCHHA|nr:hypothetical protein MS3_00006179 [Schistosoma haematobium]KAH9584659.1 hypothetical protein MS3_00006179 [Schistosoma haematobium]
MTTFATRLCGYSVVGDTYKTALDVYNWVKKKESVGPIIQTAEDKAISVIKPIVESGIVQKIDDMACQHVLDRAEAACAQIKNTSNECIILPTASRALNIAEACANLYLPKDDVSICILKQKLSYLETFCIILKITYLNYYCQFFCLIGSKVLYRR